MCKLIRCPVYSENSLLITVCVALLHSVNNIVSNGYHVKGPKNLPAQSKEIMFGSRFCSNPFLLQLSLKASLQMNAFDTALDS